MLSPRRFVVVARPRLLIETLVRRLGSRYYAAPAADSQASVKGAIFDGESAQLKKFKGREQDDFPCLSKYTLIYTV